MLTVAFHAQPARAEGPIYIRADGSIEPPTAPIQRDGDLYTLTADIIGSPQPNGAICIIERDNIILDGSLYSLQGANLESTAGVLLSGRLNVSIRNMQIRAFWMGIYSYESQNLSISNNVLEENEYGVYFSYGIFAAVNNNTFSSNVCGLFLGGVENSTFTQNNFVSSSPSWGVFLGTSSHNRIANNVFVNNSLQISALSAMESTMNLVEENVVNGKPLVYLERASDCRVDYAGQVILVDCDNIEVENLEMSNVPSAIQLLGTCNSRIENNRIAAGFRDCIRLTRSSNNTISGNLLTSSMFGAYLCVYSNSNKVVGNNITGNRNFGIGVQWSSNNEIAQNEIVSNPAIYGGCFFNEASNNLIYHNNLLNNSRAVYYYQYGLVNFWDNGYPSGGNYWSDYNGTDLFCGSNQNETGSDGIGDTLYVIDENNTDNYPLMGPWTAPGENITVSPSSDLSIIFGNVTSEGITTTNKTQTGFELLPRFKFVTDTPAYYDTRTTANYSGTIRLQFTYDDSNITSDEEQGLQLWHWNSISNEWEDITTSVDTDSNVVYGETTSLGSFVIVKPFPYDVNGNRYVGIDDIFEAASHFGAESGQPNYEALCDINKDGYIGIDDVFAVAQHFGQEY
jgi:parallel beta-helix repeat protein